MRSTCVAVWGDLLTLAVCSNEMETFNLFMGKTNRKSVKSDVQRCFLREIANTIIIRDYADAASISRNSCCVSERLKQSLSLFENKCTLLSLYLLFSEGRFTNKRF